MQVSNKPDFICIGPTKTGTTWLHANLSRHPEVWLPPVKEVHFFWGQGKRQPPTNSRYKNFKQQNIGNLYYKWRFKYAKRRVGEIIRQPHKLKLSSIAWDLKYILGPQTVNWYTGLFQKPQLTGDITPGYYILDENAIEQIQKAIPDVKIITILRDPVERLWSEAKMHLLALPGKKLNEVSDQKFFARFDLVHARCPSYASYLERWLTPFGDHLFIGFYDELQHDPNAFFARICTFLELKPPDSDHFKSELKDKVWQGVESTCPEKYLNYLTSICQANISELAALSPSPYPKTWMSKYYSENSTSETT